MLNMLKTSALSAVALAAAQLLCCVATGRGPDLPNRLRHSPVPLRWMARIRSMRKSPGRIHPTHHALARGATLANMAVSHGRGPLR